MAEVQLELDEEGKGIFFIMDGEDEAGRMEVKEEGSTLTVYHTEVNEEEEGKGLAKELLSAMTDYAREKHLKVVPLCSFVHLQFRKHPGQYEDIWQK